MDRKGAKVGIRWDEMIKLKPKQRCKKCKMLFWKKHTCQKDKKKGDAL